MVKRVLAYGLQQPVASRPLSILDEYQRLIDERAEQVEHRVALEPVTGGHLLGQVERPATGEHREAAQQRAPVLAQQLIAPVDRRAQRLLTRQRAARPSGQQAETIRERRRD